MAFLSGRLRRIVVWNSVGVDEDNSPHEARGIMEMYYGFGTIDATAPPDQKHSESLNLASIKYEMDIFEDVDHGYCFSNGFLQPACRRVSWARSLQCTNGACERQ